LPPFQALAARYFMRPSAPPAGFVPLTGALSENRAALSYARFHSRVRVFPSRAELLAALPRIDPREAWVTAPDWQHAQIRVGESSSPDSAVVPLQAEREGPNRIRITGTTPAPGIVVVAESYQAGWHARVDGRPAP